MSNLNQQEMEKNEKLIPPVDKELLKEELNKDTFFRHTNNAHNEIYVVDAHGSPHTAREIGRLRELSFRQAGGGTAKACDLDFFDTAEVPYKQLIVWDPSAEEIIGGYRYICCWEVPFDEKESPQIATAELFRFSDQFLNDFFSYSIELGRSFVQPAYQPSRDNRKSIYSLDNLWDGLGGLMVEYPGLKYFLGKVTMYQHFDTYARDLILYFMHRFFPDPDELIRPIEPLTIHAPEEELEKVFTGDSFEENYRLLSHAVRQRKENIPPLFSSYMSLSPTMRTFGTAFNEGFGGVEETGIMITIDDIYEAKSRRHVSTYKKKKA